MDKSLQTFLFFLMVTQICFAQWMQINGPAAGEVSSLVVNGSNLFAGAEYGSVAVSANNGTTWTTVNIDMTNRDVKTLAFSGTNLFAGQMVMASFFPQIMVLVGIL